MKKITQIGMILGMIFLYANAFAQTEELEPKNPKASSRTEKPNFDFLFSGVNTNFNYGKSNGILKDYKKTTWSPRIGLAFQVGIAPHFSLVSEIYFISKGGKLLSNNPLTTTETTLRLNALELPILARFHFGKFHINAGPSLAYNLWGTRKMEGSSNALSFNNSRVDFKHWDAGVQFGGGYTFKVQQKKVALDIRYCHGLTNISKDMEIYNRYLIIIANISKKKTLDIRH